MKDEGIGIFLEPLAYHPVLKVFRTLTPFLRSPEEHPFTTKDFGLLETYLKVKEVRFFYFSSLFFLPFVIFNPRLTTFFNSIDNFLFKFPWLKYLAWQCVIVLKKDKKEL